MGNLRHYFRLQSIKLIKLVKNRFNPILNDAGLFEKDTVYCKDD